MNSEHQDAGRRRRWRGSNARCNGERAWRRETGPARLAMRSAQQGAKHEIEDTRSSGERQGGLCLRNSSHSLANHTYLTDSIKSSQLTANTGLYMAPVGSIRRSPNTPTLKILNLQPTGT